MLTISDMLEKARNRDLAYELIGIRTALARPATTATVECPITAA